MGRRIERTKKKLIYQIEKSNATGFVDNTNKHKIGVYLPGKHSEQV